MNISNININIHIDINIGRLGAFNYPELLSALAVNLHTQPDGPFISPNGSIFCSPGIRKGILPQVYGNLMKFVFFP